MSKYDASLDRDANRVGIQGVNSFKSTTSVTFAAGTTGAVDTFSLFTVTGDVLLTIFAVCNTDLTSGGAATIEVGVAGNTAGLIAQTTATDIDDGDVWVDATPGVGVQALPGTFIVNDGADVIYTVGTTTITGGVLEFYCLWRPLSSDGNVVAA